MFIGNPAPDVSVEAVEDVVRKCGDVDRVMMKRGKQCFQPHTNPTERLVYF